MKVKNNTEVYVPTTSFDEPFATFMNTFYWKRPFFLDISYTAKIKKRELNDNQISKKSYIDLTPLNYENETIDIIESGYTIRRPLKDYISKEIYEIRKNLSKSQPQTNLERAEKSIKNRKILLEHKRINSLYFR